MIFICFCLCSPKAALSVGDRLYLTYQVWADRGESLTLRALNTGQKYYFAIEAFNENGVFLRSPVVNCP